MRITSIAFILLIISGFVHGQEGDDQEYRGFSFGLRLGVYQPSRTTANFYNGSGFYTSNSNFAGVTAYTVEDRIHLTPQEYSYLLSYYNASGIQFPYDSYPTAMRYNMSMSFGLDIRYRLDRYSSFILGLLSTQLKAVDKFSMQFIGTPAQLNAQNDVRLFSIEGKEQRFQALVGYRQGWMVNDQLDFFMQPMITLTGIKVVSNTAYIADRQYQLFIGAANPAQIQNYVPQTHVGMGGGIGMGFEFMLGNNHSTELCFTTTREKMQLWDYEVTGWNKTITAAFYY